MESLQDPDLNVRRATLAFFNSAVHNKPSLVRDLLDDILPLLYQETKIRRDLIREVKPWEDRDGEPLGLTAAAGARVRVKLIRAGPAHRVKFAPPLPSCVTLAGATRSSLSLSFSPRAKGEK